MTETVTETVTGTGRVVRVIGPVVDVEFPADAMPEIYFALEVDITYGGNTHTLTLTFTKEAPAAANNNSNTTWDYTVTMPDERLSLTPRRSAR